jgi:hypothetical protein
MNREQQRFVALIIAIGSALGAYVLQPDNLTVWGNPRLVAFVVGALMIVFTVVNNWLPSMFKDQQAEEAAQRQRIKDLELLLEEKPGQPGDQNVTVNVPPPKPDY